MTKFLLTFLFLLILTQPSISAVKGGINYTIPIDYSKMNVEELEPKANLYYNTAMMKQDIDSRDEDLSSALNLYAMLANKCPTNIIYPTKLGNLYEKAGKDRYAKGNYYRAIGIDNSKPEPYFGLGEYYFKRNQYRKALKFYLEAYNRGLTTNNIQNKLYIVYKKLGDSENAQKFAQK